MERRRLKKKNRGRVKLRNLKEAIGVIEKRAIEESSRRDLREVENEVTDGYAGTRRRRWLRFEDSVREILYWEVRIWVNLDE
jgi:hypothetical protein